LAAKCAAITPGGAPCKGLVRPGNDYSKPKKRRHQEALRGSGGGEAAVSRSPRSVGMLVVPCMLSETVSGVSRGAGTGFRASRNEASSASSRSALSRSRSRVSRNVLSVWVVSSRRVLNSAASADIRAVSAARSRMMSARSSAGTPAEDPRAPGELASLAEISRPSAADIRLFLADGLRLSRRAYTESMDTR